MFGRTKAEPPIYYMPTKPIIDDPAVVEQNKEKVYPSILLKNFNLCILMCLFLFHKPLLCGWI